MGLIDCPDCNKKISDIAPSCPHCGRPFKHQENQNIGEKSENSPPVIMEGISPSYNPKSNEKSYKRWVAGCLGLLVFLGVLGGTALWVIDKKYDQRNEILESEVKTKITLNIIAETDEYGDPVPITEDIKEEIITGLKGRLDEYEIKHSVKFSDSENHLIVGLPPLSIDEESDIRRILTTRGKLDFRLTHPQSTALVASQEEFVPGAELMSYDLDDFKVTHFVLREVVTDGRHIESAKVRRNDLTGSMEIHFTLDVFGANKLSMVTEDHIAGGPDPRLLCIVINGELISAPSINSRIDSRGQISGSFSEKEAIMLALFINNPIPNQLEVIDVSVRK